MNKYFFTILLLLSAFGGFSQKKSFVNLIKSDHTEGLRLNGKDVIKVYKGTFQQDASKLSSDSAYYYQAENSFDAFGHVLINQGDTLNIYSDKLNYNGNTKIAILTDNVRMIDKDAILTTNYLTYNMALRIGTYTGGGKLVNKQNTLTSKNGYYYAFTRDSYFRYNVVLITDDALIKTDTLRYNTGTRISYFYGPTDIYGTTGPKDSRDTLYTENGLYKTIPEQAFFGKKNLYKQGTKSLKGDSLFYDKLKGLGRAIKNVTFNDKEQKMVLKGDLANYYKADERTVVTENAYGTLVTEEKDTSKVDSQAVKPVIKKDSPAAKTNKIAKQLGLQTLGAAAQMGLNTDSLGTQATKTAKQFGLNKDSLNMQVTKTAKQYGLNKDSIADQVTRALTKPGLNKDSLVSKKNIALLQKQALAHSREISQAQSLVTAKMMKPDLKKARPDTVTNKKPAERIKRDTLFYTADTLETRILMYKDLVTLQHNMRLAGIRDTSIKIKKKPVVKKKSGKDLSAESAGILTDSTYSYLHRDFFGKPKPVVKKPLSAAAKRRAVQDSLKRLKPDSVYLTTKVILSDTSRVRILSAFRHAKIYKSDLQAKSDSIFYSNADSTIRCYVHPIIWAQGSQLSGDTVYLQMKNKKLDNMDVFPNAFIVNIEKDDSVHFNQAAGKKLKAYFKNDKMDRLFLDGNAESIYFVRDSLGKITELSRSLSSRIRVNFKDDKATDITLYTKPEDRYAALNKFKEDDKLLKGFIWKPKERPVSKESIIPSFRKKEAVKVAAKVIPGKKDETKGKAATSLTGKDPSSKPTGDKKTEVGNQIKKDSVKNVPIPVKSSKDTTANKQAAKKVIADN